MSAVLSGLRSVPTASSRRHPNSAVCAHGHHGNHHANVKTTTPSEATSQSVYLRSLNKPSALSGSRSGCSGAQAVGWSAVYRPVCSLIQPRWCVTREYTPGRFLRAQPSPQLTTPAWKTRPLAAIMDRGPPESPWWGQRLKVRLEITIIRRWWYW